MLSEVLPSRFAVFFGALLLGLAILLCSTSLAQAQTSSTDSQAQIEAGRHYGGGGGHWGGHGGGHR